jgi:CHAP domain
MSELNYTAASIAFGETLADTNEHVNNRGTRIDEYIRYAGLSVSADPTRSGPLYCGCFVYWCYGNAAMRFGRHNPLTHAVRGGKDFANWAERHSRNIVYRNGGGSVTLEAGDIFVVNDRTHVGMVASFAHGNRLSVSHDFPTIEGNLADPRSNSGNLQGVRRRPNRSLASVLLIYRP